MKLSTKLFKKESVIWNTDIFKFNILVVSHAYPRATILNFYLYINLFYLICPAYFTKEQYFPRLLSSQNRFYCFFPNDGSNFVRFNELIPCQFLMFIIVSPSTNTVFVQYLGCNFTVIFDCLILVSAHWNFQKLINFLLIVFLMFDRQWWRIENNYIFYIQENKIKL